MKATSEKPGSPGTGNEKQRTEGAQLSTELDAIEAMDKLGKRLEKWANDRPGVLSTLSDIETCASFSCSLTHEFHPIHQWLKWNKPDVVKELEKLYGDIQDGMDDYIISPRIAKWSPELSLSIIIPSQVLAAQMKDYAELARNDLRKKARRRSGQPKNKEAEKSIDSLKELLKDETRFSEMPRSTRKESWEWIADIIDYPLNPQNQTPRYKIMQVYLSKNCPKLYARLKRIMEKN